MFIDLASFCYCVFLRWKPQTLSPSPLFLALRNILTSTQTLCYPHLKQHILINETLNVKLYNINCCLNTVLPIFACDAEHKIWPFKL